MNVKAVTMSTMRSLLHCRKNIFLIFLLFSAISCGLSCGTDHFLNDSDKTVVEEFTDLCFRDDVDVDQMDVRLVLYLDTYNLPSQNNNIKKLVLWSNADWIYGDADPIEYYFSGDLPSEIDPALVSLIDWKVSISHASAEKCGDCWYNSGLARVILLSGSLDNVTFVYDPKDTLTAYIDPDLSK